MKIVVMGVSGCGKSTLGAALADALGLAFHEGDALHPPANIVMMRNGIPLTDADRWPWLDQVGDVLKRAGAGVVSCSALRHAYRDRIRARAGEPVRFIHLAGNRDLLATRMAARESHYMPLSLLDSQMATLEMPEPEEALTLDIALSPDALLQTSLDYLKGYQP